MPLDANEQYLLELINRARLDPNAELVRYNGAVASGAYNGPAMSSLDDGLAPGAISRTALQPLAPNESLVRAAANHSQYMLATDQFEHQGIGNGTPASRAAGEGYSSGFVGENISWSGTTGTVNQGAFLEDQHLGLFESKGHRQNIFGEDYSEIGLGAEVGQFTSGRAWNTSMLTELFGDRGSQFYVTGVIYNDTNGNRFYTPGEGVATSIAVSGIGGTSSAGAGGYSIAAGNGARQVTLGNATVAVNLAGENVKLDLMNGNQVMSSASIAAVSGVARIDLIGNKALSATGSAGSETLAGNVAANVLNGQGGNDTIYGQGGNDSIFGGEGNDRLIGGAGADAIGGGNGLDTVFYSTSRGGVSVNLATGRGASHDAQGDTLTGIEYAVGSAYADTLVGSNFANALNGGGGSDRLAGGRGADVLIGGGGADAFIFGAFDGRDVIRDFTAGADTIRIAGATNFSQLSVSNFGGDAMIAYGGTQVVLDGIATASVNADWFAFA